MFMFYDHKEVNHEQKVESVKMPTKASCVPAMKELLELRIKTKKLVIKSYNEARTYHIRRMYFQAEVKGKLRAHPVGIPWLNEPDSYAAQEFLSKAKEICEEQTIGNIPQHTNKLREITRLAQQYFEIFRDLNFMTDWTTRVAQQLETLKDTLADPWCLLTSPAPLQGELQTLYTFQSKGKVRQDGPKWDPEVVYEPWDSHSLPKVWPNSRLKVNRSSETQPDSCLPPKAPQNKNSKGRSRNRKPTETKVDTETQPERCNSPSLPKQRFPRKSYAEILAMINQDEP
jgi:hypothetical protein